MDNRLDIPADAVWVKVADALIGALPEPGTRVQLTHAMGYKETYGKVLQRSGMKKSVQVVPEQDLGDPASWRVTP